MNKDNLINFTCLFIFAVLALIAIHIFIPKDAVLSFGTRTYYGSGAK